LIQGTHEVKHILIEKLMKKSRIQENINF